MVTASPKVAGLTVVLLTLLHCLLLAHCQKLEAGHNCNGQRYDMCQNGTVCSYTGSRTFRNHCLLDLGENCRDQKAIRHYLSSTRCRRELTCESTCKLRLATNCKGNENRCTRNAVCDALSTCSLKVGKSCYSTTTWCGAGAECKNWKCRCLSGIAKKRRSKCKPNRGIVTGRCLKRNRCKDVYATCNNTTDTCECSPGFVVTSPTFACKLEVGQSCAGAKKDLCRPGTKCDVDNICKLIPGESCAGDLKNMCLTGHVCAEDMCRVDIGGECEEYDTYGKRACVRGKYCDDICRLDVHDDCRDYPDSCQDLFDEFCDNVTYTCKHKIGRSYCNEDAECPAGAHCVDHYISSDCVCLYSGQSFAHGDRVCGLPKGKVGSQCENVSDSSATGCHDPHAWCNKTSGLCECSTYYKPNYNYATCELNGPRCTMKGDGTLTTFFNEAISVHLPCRAKLASFVCGGAQIEVYSSKTYYTKIEDTYVDSVMVNITTTDDDGKTSFQAYEVTRMKIRHYMSKPSSETWEKVYTNNTNVDNLVNFSINSTTGMAELTRDLFRVAYQPPVFGTSHPVESWGRLDIACGDPYFEAKEKYPAVLCGSNTNTKEDLANFQKHIELEMKGQFPDYYGFVPQAAFRSPRLTDRAILQRQDMHQPDQHCREASRIVTDGCVGLAEKLYNCSHMYDAKNPDYLSYATCIQKDMPPMKMYMACLRVLCNNIPEGTLENTRDTISKLRSCRLKPFSRYAYPKRFTPSDLLDLLS